MRRRVHRFAGGLAGALVLVGLALLAAEPLLLAATAIPLTYVAYGALSRVPSPVSLSATRSVADRQTPGELAAVELTVENTGERTLTDVRLVDGVPTELAVVEGSPRCCTALRPGESVTVEYAVRTKRGTHTFSGTDARVRPLAASETVTTELAVDGDGSLTCANTVGERPATDATLPLVGSLPTDSGGPGLAFHSTRQYQYGDPASRIDWRRYAKTTDLTTVDYRERRAVRTVLVVDARPPVRATPDPAFPTGAELSAYAAERLLETLSRTGVVASVAAVGLADADLPGGVDPDGLVWVDDSGRHARERVATVVDGVGRAATRWAAGAEADGGAAPNREDQDGETPVDAVTADGGPDPIRALLGRLPARAEVVVLSPATDDWIETLLADLSRRDYPTTLVSPDVTRRDSMGASVLAVERAERLRRVELGGTAVVDWDLEEPLDTALRASLAEVLGE
jgi:uncharacterized repeat protein (TIGR01451 family)